MIILSFTGVNEELECVETAESMNILCISIRVTCTENNSNDQIEFRKTFQNLDVPFL